MTVSKKKTNKIIRQYNLPMKVVSKPNKADFSQLTFKVLANTTIVKFVNYFRKIICGMTVFSFINSRVTPITVSTLVRPVDLSGGPIGPSGVKLAVNIRR